MKLFYQSIGAGPPLVILHGLLGSHENWRGIANSLSRHHRAHLLDLRNHGRSPPNGAMTYPLMAADIAEFIEQHQLIDPTLNGHSMGGGLSGPRCPLDRRRHCAARLRALPSAADQRPAATRAKGIP